MELRKGGGGKLAYYTDNIQKYSDWHIYKNLSSSGCQHTYLLQCTQGITCVVWWTELEWLSHIVGKGSPMCTSAFCENAHCYMVWSSRPPDEP